MTQFWLEWVRFVKKFLITIIFLNKNVNFDHFKPFFACFGHGISFQSTQWVYLTYFWLDRVRLAKKLSIIMIFLRKMPILAILGYFWLVFGLVWLLYQCPKLSLSIFDLVLTGLSEICEKKLNINDLFNENAKFGHLKPFMAWFLPVMILIAVS